MTKYKLANKIVGEKNCYLIIVQGHSGYAEKGKDIVCSSISTSINLLIKNLIVFEQKILQIKLEDGSFRMKVEITNYSEKLIKAFYEFLEELEENYSDFVKQDDTLK